MEKDKRVALIDMGTNTFHLLITEIRNGSEPQDLVKIKEPVKLGEGGISHGEIAPAAYARALKTLKDFKSLIDQHNVEEVKAMATSAVRNAANGQELIRDIASETGITVETINGDQEAELIYYGVKSALEIGFEKSLIMDIGGGSVEFIICDDHQIFWKQSFEIGAQRLLDKFFITDPLEEHAMEALKLYLQEQLEPLTQAIERCKPTVLIGSSGTFDTLCDIDSKRKGLDREQDCCPEADLALADFYEIYEDILRKNRSERLAIPGMLEMRVDMIVMAIILIDFVLENYFMNKIRVSAYALKEGMLYRMLNQGNT
jgi:exopolyphosphatase / guanosine-5'-triphosphate,3'-diphosphate pyrophosphatase